jgi:hypothetical protein
LSSTLFFRLGSVPTCTDWTTARPIWKAIPKFGDARKFDVKHAAKAYIHNVNGGEDFRGALE